MLTVEEKAFLAQMAAKHLPGRHDQSSHGRPRRPKLPDPPAGDSAPKPARAPKPKPGPSDEPPETARPKKPRAARHVTVSPARAKAMQASMLDGRPWTPENVDSLYVWTTSGYHDIRMMINNPDHEPFLDIGNRAQVKAHIRNMHDAMRPLPKNVKVFRKTDQQGVGLGGNDDPKQLVGKRKQNANFTATSIEPDSGRAG